MSSGIGLKTGYLKRTLIHISKDVSVIRDRIPGSKPLLSRNSVVLSKTGDLEANL
jgi:hypothetical protein